jgi:hypothetical protein
VAQRRAISTVTLILLLGVFLAGCSGLGATRIGKILDDPRHYHGRDVTVAGEVVDSLNLLVFRTYTVRDRTGEILVVTKGAVPREGASVRVKGKVNQAFAIADKSLVVLIEADR